MAKLGGTTELFGPLSGDRRLFFVSRDAPSVLKQPRSGAGVRTAGLY
ncbi:hypothetical protein [Hungatella effluvii]|nr:hypothetical protein [Hungatella effluvii]